MGVEVFRDNGKGLNNFYSAFGANPTRAQKVLPNRKKYE
jgi:hypothetical protein